MTDRFEVAVIGAGAAGLAAAKILAAQRIPFVLLEASHRIGGRAHTEYPPDGAAFDLGCHWMHSASINPFVSIADEYSVRYEKRDDYGPDEGYFRGGQWLSEPALESLEKESEAAELALAKAWSEGLDRSVADVTDRDGEWTSVLDYYSALNTSSDSDEVSIGDVVSYEDTHENWPVVDGYGQLVERWGSDVPVSLNSEVRAIHWGDKEVRLDTARGEVRAKRVIITVSTGILASGVLRFFPELPQSKQSAIAALPLGNYNHVRFWINHRLFPADVPERVLVEVDNNSPILLNLRPHGFDCVIGLVAGRYADWLERSGPVASAAVVKEALSNVFGHDIVRHIRGDQQSAWRGNPFVRGAYSSAVPGAFHQRAVLAETIADRLFFAGEATSLDHFCTCHGAMMSGELAVGKVLEAIASAQG
jgi:monoamine oxidase